jgi:Copper binding periplasmic protein CusF
MLAGVLVATFLFIEARRLWPNKRLRERLVDRINRTVAIQQTQSGTIGANTAGAAEEFKAQNGLSLDTLHAGDKVTFSATETGGIKTITKLQQQ